jgi:DNA-binding beta-propeller fold protein YncE
MAMRLIALAALLAFASAPVGAKPPHYRVARTVALGAPDDWDFVHFDPAQGRVYVAHSTEVTVIDGRSGALVGRIAAIKGAHDVAVVPELGRGYADNGDTGNVTVFDLRTLRPLGTIPADADADAMVYDPVTKLLVVGSGDAQAASIIDVRAAKKLASVPLGGSAEGIVRGGGGKVFINVDTLNTIARLDLRTRRIDARWPTPGCEAPHGLAYDRSARRLFASCKNGRMIVVDARTGKALALLPIGLGTDSAGFDPLRKWAFSANKAGTLSVVSERRGRFVALGNVPTAPGAKNMAIDPRTGRIFLVAATVTATHPPRKAGGPPDYDFAPGSVKLIILDPTREGT